MGQKPTATEPGAKPVAPAFSAPQRAMRKLGLVRDIDLALHLPLRHEDETAVVPIGGLRDGQTAQVEGVVRESQVELRSRRQLVVRLADESGALTLRFLNFYPSHQKTMARGQRLRVRGEVRHGFFGPEMLHPSFRAVQPGDPLPAALTPVYPAGAQLPQAYLRKAIAAALARAPLQEVLPPGAVPPGLPGLKTALQTLHHPPPDVDDAALADRTHPAWERLKFEELLAQQLAQAQAVAARARLRAPVLAGCADWANPAAASEPPGAAAAPRKHVESQSDAAPTRSACLHERLLATLPFALTAAQARVCAEIDTDLARPVPMHRLLQGDVGSGKTVVAALAAARAIDAGWQCALMAPTEILAEQHFRKLVQWLVPLGVTVAWLTGSRKGKVRERMRAQVASGEAALVVGTHAVIQDDVVFARLGLAIVDEQHRFGVAQRLALRHKLAGSAAHPAVPMDDLRSVEALFKAGSAGPGANPGSRPPGAAAHADVAQGLEPHLLTMSATPIPRTLAMTYFADLDVSTIDELPPGRTPIVTKVFADSRRLEVIARIRDEVERGRQVYWVCPLIEESEHLDLQHATAVHAELCGALGESLPQGAGPDQEDQEHGTSASGRRAALSTPPPSSGEPAGDRTIGSGAVAAVAPPPSRPPRVALLHGRMPANDKAAVMEAFSRGQTAVLVATTVIEVGVDVPNASLMVIEHAERFGLAQLHQLRGRVGRGEVASVCVLLYTPPLSDTGKARLRAMAETTDGFEIARRDLKIRGPGEFMGARQSGEDLLRFADLDGDAPLLAHARRIAPQLLARHPEAAQAHVARWLSSKAEYLKA